MSAFDLKAFLYRFSPGFLSLVYQRIDASPLGYRLARGAFWSLAGSLISRGLGLLSGIFVGRFLGKQAFGELGMIQSTVGLFGTVAGFGMGMMATRYVAELRSKDPVRAGRIIALSSATTWISSGTLALALVIFAPWLAEHTLAAPKLAGLLRVGALLLLLGGVNSAQTGALSGFEAFKAISRINLFTGLLSFPMMVLGAWFFGVAGAVWGLIGNYAVNSWLNWNALRQEARKSSISLNYAGCWAERTVFWRFNLPAVINSITFSFLGWAGGALLAQQQSGYGDLGVYNAVLRIKMLPESIASIMLAPLLPVLSESFGRKDKSSYHKTIMLSFGVFALLIVPPALLQIAAPWVTLAPYGREYQGGHAVVQWLMLNSVAYGLLCSVSNILISLGRMWLAQALGMLYVALYLGLAWWLIPLYGAAGFACAGCCAMTFANVPTAIIIYRQFAEPMREIRWLRMVAASLVCVVVAILASHRASNALSLLIGCALAVGFIIWCLVSSRARLQSQVKE